MNNLPVHIPDDTTPQTGVILTDRTQRTVSFPDDGNLRITTPMTTLKNVFLGVAAVFAIPYFIGELLLAPGSGILSEGLMSNWLGFLILCGFMAEGTYYLVEGGAKKELFFDKASRALTVSKSLYRIRLSEKVNFRTADDYQEIRLLFPKMETDTLQEKINKAMKPNAALAPCKTLCELVFKDNSKLLLWDLYYNGTKKHFHTNVYNELIFDDWKAANFLRIIHTAQRIAEFLNIPLHIYCKDSEYKGKETLEEMIP